MPPGSVPKEPHPNRTWTLRGIETSGEHVAETKHRRNVEIGRGPFGRLRPALNRIARSKLMGRCKVREVRGVAEAQGWLERDRPRPEDAVLAKVFTSPGRAVTPSLVEPFGEKVTAWSRRGLDRPTIHRLLRRRYGFTGDGMPPGLLLSPWAGSGFSGRRRERRLLIKEQSAKTGLNEVPVCRQCIYQASLLHHYERETIRQAPFLVGSVSVELRRQARRGFQTPV